MPGMRLLLLLLIFGGLALFALQNWSPFLPLVVLGVRTLELPLAVWMLGAIAAGALTTLLITILYRISNSFAVSSRRRARPLKRGRGDAFTGSADAPPWQSGVNDPAWTSGWSNANEPQPVDRSPYRPFSNSADSRKTAANDENGYEDDWETPRRDDWEEWGDRASPTNQQPYQDVTYRQVSGPTPFYQDSYPRPEDDLPNIEEPDQDAEDEEWANWDGYEDVASPPAAGAYRDADERDDFDDEDSVPLSDRPQPRDYEVRQEPEMRYQSGTIYSYSYRKSDNLDEDEFESIDPEEPEMDSPTSVYDAEYRVIRPPIIPNEDMRPPESPTTLQTGANDGDDWGFDDEELDELAEEDDR